MKPPKLPTILPAPNGRIIRYPDGRVIKHTPHGISIEATTDPTLTIKIKP